MSNLLVLVALAASCYLILCILRPAGVMDLLLLTFLSSASLIISWGYLLASMGQLRDLNSWALISGLTTLILIPIALVRKVDVYLPASQALSIRKILTEWRIAFSGTTPFIRFSLVSLAVVVLLVGALNLAFIVLLPPHEWDSMTYHLPRVAHYLQQGNLNAFGANYWAQVVHPKNSAILLSFAFITLGHNENLMQLVAFLSYWALIIGVYGIAGRVGLDRTQRAFSALLAALLITPLVYANTTQNDLTIAAYVAASVYFLFIFRDTKAWKYLAFAALGVGLALGTKASALIVLPSLGLLVLFLTRTDNVKAWIGRVALFAGLTVVAILAFALPSGYVENYRLFGSPFGNEDVSRMHTFSDRQISSVLQGGAYNLLRYGVDVVSLDGLPPNSAVTQIQQALHIPPKRLFSTLGVDLETRESTSFSWFEYGRLPRGIYWGVFGFGLIWVVVVLALFRVIRQRDFLLLAGASALFWLSIAFSGPYDAAKGRFFVMCIPFAVPMAGIAFSSKNRAVQLYLTVLIAVGSLSALSAVTTKALPLSATYPQYIEKRTILEMDRLEQLTFNYQRYYRPLVAFEHIVPADAHVAAFLYPNTLEYPLHGRYLTRTILPINSFHKGLLPIPAEAQYLLYANGYPCPLPGDRYLGADWYLRILSDANRECPFADEP